MAQRVVAFATKHEKEQLLAEQFARELNWRVVRADVDTDAFGTFSGEVPRLLSPKNAALAKARAGMQRLGVSAGLASEGTIGPHPALPFISANWETLAFIDDELGIEIVESYLGTDIVAVSARVTPETPLVEICARADTPNHAVMVSAREESTREVRKGLFSIEEVSMAVAELALDWPDSEIWIESDFRAMCSPSRQRNIAACAEKLIGRILSLCPKCATPGWGVVGGVYGLPCHVCGLPVETALRAHRWGCTRCKATEIKKLGAVAADPSRCPVCNP